MQIKICQGWESYWIDHNNISDLGDAVKCLEAKMEGLIVLINNPFSCLVSSRRTKDSKTNRYSLQQKYELIWILKFSSFDFNINQNILNFWLLKVTTASAAFFSSCKEQQEKDK